MVDFKRLTDRAKDVVEKRGGKDALKDDMQELRNIAKGQGSLKEKAMAAKDALKDPGREGRAQPAAGAKAPHAGGTERPATEPTPSAKPATPGPAKPAEPRPEKPDAETEATSPRTK